MVVLLPVDHSESPPPPLANPPVQLVEGGVGQDGGVQPPLGLRGRELLQQGRRQEGGVGEVEASQDIPGQGSKVTRGEVR